MTIKDSGERREFETGAVRDIAEGKGRCDLMPLDIVAEFLSIPCHRETLGFINRFLETGSTAFLYQAISKFQSSRLWTTDKLLLELSIHYEQGAQKYGEHNWEKGIPLHCYIDSAVRHLIKCSYGWDDEPHDRAFVWNIVGAIWTVKHKPELIDMTFKENNGIDDSVRKFAKASKVDDTVRRWEEFLDN